jgi:hypothetical protein
MSIKNPPHEINGGVGGLNLTPSLVNPLVATLKVSLITKSHVTSTMVNFQLGC